MTDFALSIWNHRVTVGDVVLWVVLWMVVTRVGGWVRSRT